MSFSLAFLTVIVIAAVILAALAALVLPALFVRDARRRSIW
jgi:hypothetical protein